MYNGMSTLLKVYNMFKIVEKDFPHTFSEIYQANPIRWQLLHRKGNTLTQQHHQIKCKDYFNDVVCKIHTGLTFTKYGFNTAPILVPEPGEEVYVQVHNLLSKFETNLVLLNTWLADKFAYPPLVFQDSVMIFPAVYFSNTHHVSLITLLVRMCNSNTELVLDGLASNTADDLLWKKAVIKNVFFKLPDTVKNYVWYCGKDYNSKTKTKVDYGLPQLVHNNGFISWQSYF